MAWTMLRRGQWGKAMARILAATSILTLLATLVRAQTADSPSLEGTALAGDLPAGAFVVTVMIALLAIGVVVKVSDREHRRREAVVALQIRLGEALLMDPVLCRLPVTTSAHARFWHRSPVTITLRGRVPTPALRGEAIALVTREAVASGIRFRVDDRVDVDPSMLRHAA
jgi:hypothetical protein